MYTIFFDNIMIYTKTTVYLFAIHIKTAIDKMPDYTFYIRSAIICQSRK